MRDFYVTLFSNSSMNFYPGNKTGSFTVQLPRTMSLNGEWVVALTEIQYPYSFFNVQNGQNEIKIKEMLVTKKVIEFISTNKVTPEVMAKKFKPTWISCKIEPGYYTSAEKLLNAVNAAILEKTKNVNFFELDTASQKVKAVPAVIAEGNRLILGVKLSERLAVQLGYNPNYEITEENSAAIHVLNLTSGIPDKMLIYCDIIEPQIIGDKCAKVMRTVTMTPDGAEPYFAKAYCKDFTQLQYIPLQTKNFESISIDIRDITSGIMPFQFGTSSVKLHFKRL